MRFLLSITCILFLFSCSSKEKPASNAEKTAPNIELVVHRGANRLAPENTLTALKLAIEQGADYIEVDLATSKDSVFYCFHDKTLDRTTNGTGIIAEKTSAYIDSLDAGSWFSVAYAGEPVPRVEEILEMARGKAKIYFDVKNTNLDQLINFIREEDIADDCFVWFSDQKLAKEFQKMAPDIALKMNASNKEELNELLETYQPKIIECDAYKITPEFQQACKEKELKLMANLLRDSWWEYQKAIEMQVDMVNIDHPDYFSQMLQHPEHIFTDYRLIAHRGGIVEDVFDEFDPRSIEAAIDSGYWMLEIDVQPTADKQLIVHHDYDLQRIYGVDKKVSEMTLAELKQLNARNGGYNPLTFEEAAAMCAGKIHFMVDIKPRQPEEWFCRKIYEVLEKHNMAEDTWYIRNDVRKYFPKGKFGFRMTEAWDMKERLDKGEDIIANYYLFDHGNRINAEAARWCQLHNIDVCASVNIGHYRMEDDYYGAKRDIKYLKKSGVTAFQIDSDYDAFFELTHLLH